jgi:integrase
MPLDESALMSLLLDQLEAHHLTPEQLVAFRDGELAGAFNWDTAVELSETLTGLGGNTYATYWRYLTDGDPAPVCTCYCDGCVETRRPGPRGRCCDGRKCAVTFDGFTGRTLASITAAEVKRAAQIRQCRAQVNGAVLATNRRNRGRTARETDGQGAYAHVITAATNVFAKAFDEEKIAYNPLANLHVKRNIRRHGRALNESQLQELWDVVCTTGDDVELDMLIIWFMLETACRRGALLRLRLCDLLFEQERVVLRGKGSKPDSDKKVTPELLAALRRHAFSRGGGADTDAEAPVFYYRPGRWQRGHVNFKGGEWTDEAHPIGKSRIETIFRRVQTKLPWADEIGVHPHDMRRTVAAIVERLYGHAVAGGFLDHAPADTTGRYDAATRDEVDAALEGITRRV